MHCLLSNPFQGQNIGDHFVGPLGHSASQAPQTLSCSIPNAFGGASLVNEHAKQLSCKMVADKIPFIEAWYLKEVIQVIKSKFSSAAYRAIEIEWFADEVGLFVR